jgi:hypothetical protein
VARAHGYPAARERPSPGPATAPELYYHVVADKTDTALGASFIEVARFAAPADAVVLSAGLQDTEFRLLGDSGAVWGNIFVAAGQTLTVRVPAAVVEARQAAAALAARTAAAGLYRR